MNKLIDTHTQAGRHSDRHIQTADKRTGSQTDAHIFRQTDAHSHSETDRNTYTRTIKQETRNVASRRMNRNEETIMDRSVCTNDEEEKEQEQEVIENEEEEKRGRGRAGGQPGLSRHI